MRADVSSPIYTTTVATGERVRAYGATVLLDGVELPRCVECDTDEGWADVLVPHDGAGPELVRRYGKVTLLPWAKDGTPLTPINP